MTGRIVLLAFVGLLAAGAAVMLWLAASGVALWPETTTTTASAATTSPPPRIAAPPSVTSATVRRSDGTGGLATAVPEAPVTALNMPHLQPAFDPATFSERCMAFARRTDTEPSVLAADQRMCDCFGKTLKPADYAMMLDYTEIDPRARNAQGRYIALYAAYGLSENQYATELNRVRQQGKACTASH